MATYLIYASSPADCVSLTAIAAEYGKTATDGKLIAAVRYNGPLNDLSQAIEKKAPTIDYLVIEVTRQLSWKSSGSLSGVGDLIIGLG